MKKLFTNLRQLTMGIAISLFPSFGYSQLFSDHFDNSSVSSFLAISGSFTPTESGTQLQLTSAGHGEWDNLTYIINNGVASPISMTSQTSIFVRARAVSSNATIGTLAITVVDNNNNDVNNPTIAAVNKFRLTNQFQVFELKITAWNSQWNTGQNVDSNNVAKLVLAINPAWFSYPSKNNSGDSITDPFIGDVYIDYVSIGQALPTGVKKFSVEEQSIKVYPNPSSDKIFVEADNITDKNVSVKVMDHAGKLLLETKASLSESIDVSHLEKGAYILSIETSEGIINRKLFKY